MKPFHKTVALATLTILLSGNLVFAQEHGHYIRHNEWKKGSHISHDDWNRGEQIDYKRYHLNAPPRGYEWRQVDGNYVRAAAATGLIASAIVASTVH